MPVVSSGTLTTIGATDSAEPGVPIAVIIACVSRCWNGSLSGFSSPATCVSGLTFHDCGIAKMPGPARRLMSRALIVWVALTISSQSGSTERIGASAMREYAGWRFQSRYTMHSFGIGSKASSSASTSSCGLRPGASMRCHVSLPCLRLSLRSSSVDTTSHSSGSSPLSGVQIR